MMVSSGCHRKNFKDWFFHYHFFHMEVTSGNFLHSNCYIHYFFPTIKVTYISERRTFLCFCNKSLVFTWQIIVTLIYKNGSERRECHNEGDLFKTWWYKLLSHICWVFFFIFCGDIFDITHSICDIQIRAIPFKFQKKQRIKYIFLFQNTIDKFTCQAFKLLKKWTFNWNRWNLILYPVKSAQKRSKGNISFIFLIFLSFSI